MSESGSRAIPADYDSDPERFLGGAAIARHRLVSDVHDELAERVTKEQIGPVVDVGCGDGRLLLPLLRLGTVAVCLDSSWTMLALAAGPRVLGHAARLPFESGSFGAIVALYMLYHLPVSERVRPEPRWPGIHHRSLRSPVSRLEGEGFGPVLSLPT